MDTGEVGVTGGDAAREVASLYWVGNQQMELVILEVCAVHDVV
jgi:hypothetical protein